LALGKPPSAWGGLVPVGKWLLEQPSLVSRLALWMLLAVFAVFSLSSIQVWGADFACLWSGARAAIRSPEHLYDFEFVTRGQPWVFGSAEHPTMRPFISPPTALFLLAPFGLLPYPAAYGLWVTLTTTFYAAMARKAGVPIWFLLFTCVVEATTGGQVTTLIGALVLAALMSPRPVICGLLFGLAACIKPQAVFLFPVALIAAENWRALSTAFATGLTLVIASALVWGPERWLEWVSALRRFAGIVSSAEFLAAGITPFAALASIGLTPWLAALLLPLSVAIVWTVFRKTKDPLLRLTALSGAGLLSGSYALRYEMALLAPAVARQARLTTWGVIAAMLFAMTFWGAGQLGLVLSLGLVGVTLLGRDGSLRAVARSAHP